MSEIVFAEVDKKADCLFVVGNGEFYHYGSYEDFEKDVLKMKSRWNNICSTQKIYMSGGAHDSYVIDKKNAFTLKQTRLSVDAAATKKNVVSALGASPKNLVYALFDDHGGEKGTALFDAQLTPQELRSQFQKTPQKQFRILFKHCYSGQMLEALYDSESGKIYGCGVAITYKEIGYSGGLGNFDKPDIYSHSTIGGQAVTDFNGFALNTQIITSDFFLLNYRHKSPKKTEAGSAAGCASCEKSLSDTDQITIQTEIEALKERVRLLKQWQEEHKKELGSNYTPFSLEEIDKISDAYYAERNKLFYAELKKKDPRFLQGYKEVKKDYEDCILKNADAGKCNESQFKSRQAEMLRRKKTFSQNHLISEIPEKARPNGAVLDSFSFEAAEKIYDSHSINIRYETQNSRRIQLIESKIASLESIKNSNDARAFKLWKDLTTCEVSSAL